MNRGFTLVELLIALAVSGIIMTGIFSAFKTQQDSYLAQEQVAEMQQNLRASLYIMTREIRMAGYDGGNGSSVTGNPRTDSFRRKHIHPAEPPSGWFKEDYACH